ncbi:hypothetical protein LIER_34686 [Lithospermum erythrorhizon]|uniref:Uncharacterized protein n=1 Tax=Lithospermum erythrorhizon TaxID=34254 RepID=A0AAV3S0C3_LITER
MLTLPLTLMVLGKRMDIYSQWWWVVGVVRGCSNHVIGEEVKVYKDLKVTGTPVIEGQEMETVNVMSAKEVYEDKIVLPNTQELQENMQIKLQPSPLEDVADETEYGELRSPIDRKLRERRFSPSQEVFGEHILLRHRRRCRLVNWRRTCQSNHKLN